jgi:hypothetical protein
MIHTDIIMQPVLISNLVVLQNTLKPGECMPIPLGNIEQRFALDSGFDRHNTISSAYNLA